MEYRCIVQPTWNESDLGGERMLQIRAAFQTTLWTEDLRNQSVSIPFSSHLCGFVFHRGNPKCINTQLARAGLDPSGKIPSALPACCLQSSESPASCPSQPQQPPSSLLQMHPLAGRGSGCEHASWVSPKTQVGCWLGQEHGHRGGDDVDSRYI